MHSTKVNSDWMEKNYGRRAERWAIQPVMTATWSSACCPASQCCPQFPLGPWCSLWGLPSWSRWWESSVGHRLLSLRDLMSQKNWNKLVLAPWSHGGRLQRKVWLGRCRLSGWTVLFTSVGLVGALLSEGQLAQRCFVILTSSCWYC